MGTPRTRKGKKPATRRAGSAKTTRPAGAKLSAALRERDEALQQQAATSEILRVISSSPRDRRPAFDAILKSALRLCDAHLGVLNLREGDGLRTVAQRGGSAEFAAWVFERGVFKPDGGAVVKAVRAGRVFQVADYRQSADYLARKPNIARFTDLGGVRTFLAVPLLRDREVIGNIGIYRREVRPFTDRQIELVKTFADQAVIAIENARLFNETKEALERQTATAEILQVIASSPSDVRPVFQAIAESSRRLIGGLSAAVSRVADGMLHLAAYASTD
jgi:two-component system, NtrC family, sensor kinase